MTYTIADFMFLVVRVCFLGIYSLFIFSQIKNIIEHKGSNGLTETRKALLVYTVASFVTNAYLFIGDIHALFLGSSQLEWVSMSRPGLFIARLFELAGAGYFYNYIFRKQKEHDEKVDH